MILNTGSRTDIPAFFSEWFYKRIEEGYVMVRNPYYPSQVLRYRLEPEVVDGILFCTKNPKPMLEKIHCLDAFRQLWFVTVTPYGKEIEPGVPEKGRVLETFRELSGIVGKRAVIWRYDPIFLSEKYSLEFHMEAFERMAAALEGYTECCVISFIDLYEKTKRNFPGVKAVGKEERMRIGREFVRIGGRYGMEIRSCCEGTELEVFGVNCSGCMTKEVVERAFGCKLEVPGGGKSAREGCHCLLGNDIGVYHSCGHGCLYCYANDDAETVRRNRRRHEVDSPFLVGGAMEGDEVREVRQESWVDGQLSLEDFWGR
ncbi:MAG: DUF1848 domain-containing protein [Eubacteriales bacterium]|nr:DUF1848 domain-containing protein [Eubacteriales bacterium]